ncbi:type 1 glutamine amidotransferase domain-containing protein [Leptolyngbya sp. 7M]|uniref:type 1 glutamine amidotransferase domain-containing protein n=1 Tax=Leptolyngbya sp. 7M TaxID=2812896 RepID=UPI0028F3ED36|nr:type 1 glutamine amidotransferase domain-containing protein [Leptolyngbya sp. 7M]
MATDGFEETELTEPVRALRDAKAQVDVISNKTGQIQAFRHHDKSITVNVDRSLDQVQPNEYDAVLLPGGALNTDTLRAEPKVKSFLQQMQQAGKPFAVICHAPWLLISADLVKGRTLTSYYTIQDDIRNAGGHWIERDVIVDRNWVTSRQPDDIPVFNQEMLNLFAQMAPATSGSR